jgi:hypothetical protein
VSAAQPWVAAQGRTDRQSVCASARDGRRESAPLTERVIGLRATRRLLEWH